MSSDDPVIPPNIRSILADNRGQIEILLNGDFDSVTIPKGAVQVYTAGADRLLNDDDDVKLNSSLNWNASLNRIIVTAKMPANTAYKVRIVSARVRDNDGVALDGDFSSGRLPTGNGRGGGDCVFRARTDVSDTPKARMVTSAGTMTIKLFRDDKPGSVENFISYANAGNYDGIFWTRSVPDFLIQAGGLSVKSSNDKITPVPADDPITNEFEDNGVISNTRGTLAFAKQPGDPDSATNQFFFNLQDNGGTAPLGLDFQNGGFTVFGQLADQASLDVMDAISELPTVALNNPATGDGVVPVTPAASLTSTPIKATEPLQFTLQDFGTPGVPNPQYVAIGGFDASRDLIQIQRTSILMRVQSFK